MQSIEEWRPVVGYEDIYEVSNHGRVRSLDHIAHHRSSQTGTYLIRGRILRLVPTGAPKRLQVTLHRAGSQRTRLVHHLVLEAFAGPRPDGTECAHGDGDATNNHADNLRWATHLANEADKARHGTHGNRVKVVCPYGHRLVAPNLVPSEVRRGYRKCRACNMGRAYAQKHGRHLFEDRAHLKYAQLMAEEAVN